MLSLSESSKVAYNTLMKINIPHIAKLANLTISPDEEEKFEKQLSSILGHVERLSEIDTTNIGETSQVTGLENVTRVDASLPSMNQSDALSQSVNTHNGFFAVKGVFENE